MFQKKITRPADPTLRRASIFRDRPHKVRWHHITRERRIQAECGRALFQQLAEVYGRHCLVCGATKRLTLDHIVPVSKGGRTVIENLQILCYRHNVEKGDFIMDFRPEREAERG